MRTDITTVHQKPSMNFDVVAKLPEKWHGDGMTLQLVLQLEGQTVPSPGHPLPDDSPCRRAQMTVEQFRERELLRHDNMSLRNIYSDRYVVLSPDEDRAYLTFNLRNSNIRVDPKATHVRATLSQNSKEATMIQKRDGVTEWNTDSRLIITRYTDMLLISVLNRDSTHPFSSEAVPCPRPRNRRGTSPQFEHHDAACP